jgi:hypothetical protein
MSQTLLEKNLEALRKVSPALADAVLKADGGPYEILRSESKGLPNLLYLGCDPPVLFQDPETAPADVERFLNRFREDRSQFYVVLGIGPGYGVLQLLRDRLFKKVIVIEKDLDCFRQALEMTDFADVFANPLVKFLVGCPEQDLYIEVHRAVDPHLVGLKEVKFLPSPASIAIAGDYYRQVVKAFKDVANIYIAERGNDPYDTLVGYEQFFTNIRAYLENPAAGYVKDLFKGRPAIVVATGPSLQKNVHLLKEAENRAVIVSADASLRILHKHGIHPHLVTTIERTPGFDKQFRDLDHLDKTVFATISFAHPTTLSGYRGPLLFFNRIYNFMDKLNLLDDCMQLGLSTANMAYEVARHLGCSPIILIGNDLAFDGAGNTHAQGFLYGQKQPVYEEFDRFAVPGNVDEWVTTCEGWFNCIKQYEKRVDGWDGTLINATAGGARIRGSVVMPLRDVLQTRCAEAFYPRETLLGHLAAWRKDPARGAHILTQLDGFLALTERFIGISRKMCLFLDAMLRDIENCGGELPKRLQKEIEMALPHINDALDGLTDSPLTSTFGEYFFTEIVPYLMEWQVAHGRFQDEKWADAYRIKLAGNFFGATGQLCVSLRNVLLDGRHRLRALEP